MLKCYLCLMLCLQFALINAARARRGSNGASGGGGSTALNLGSGQEHIHIKVHIPDVQSRSRPHPSSSQRYRKPQHGAQHQRGPINYKNVLPTFPTHGNSKEMPYEFDYFGVSDEDNSLPMPDLMHGIKSGPVVFTSNLNGGLKQHPMSQQFMQQLFTPEIMSALKAESDEQTSTAGMVSGIDDEPLKLDANELMQAYFQKLNQPKLHTRSPTISPLTTIDSNSNWSTKLMHKRKKYGNIGIGEAYPKDDLQTQFYKQQQLNNNKPTKIAKAQRYQHQQPPPLHQFQASLNQNFEKFQNDFFDNDAASVDSQSDELEAVENVSLETSEDMQTAFNGLKPISYHDMYGEYATPITTSTSTYSSAAAASSPLATSLANRHQHQQKKQQDFDFQHETIPTYTTSPIATPTNAINNWLQYQQRPELYKPQHHQHHQQQKAQKLKPKSQQTQFVLQPPTTLRFASSPSTTTSSLSSSSPTLLSSSPISSGFGFSKNGISNGISNGIGGSGSLSSAASTWSWAPYDFVQQSHQQQLLDAQQRPRQRDQQQQHHQQQQHQHASAFNKKRKNSHTKRKRNRIIVE